jgi:hypothetical protein
MDDDTEIERMLDEKMQEDVQKKEKEQIINKNGHKKDKDKDKDKDKEKKHKKHHKHHKHKSHKNEKKHERKRSRSPRRSRSPNDRRHRSPTPPTLPSGKRRDVNSELHQLAKTISRQTHSKESSSKSKKEKSPELTPEERDLRTVFCKNNFLRSKKKIYQSLLFI